MNNLTLFFLLLLSSFAFGLSDDTVATVNGKKIYKKDFLKAYRQNKLFLSEKIVTKQKVLNDLAAKIIGVEKAKASNLHNDPLVVEKTEDILFHAQISKDLEKKLNKITVSKKEIKKYYQKRPEYNTAQILLRTKAEISKKDLSDTLVVAKKLYKKIKNNPAQFGNLANTYSQVAKPEDVKTNGVLGFQPASFYAPEYFSAIHRKNVGYISPPIKTQFGYHIIKILGVKKFKNINNAFYKQVVYKMKRNVILDQYFNDLRRNANIKINKNLLKSIR